MADEAKVEIKIVSDPEEFSRRLKKAEKEASGSLKAIADARAKVTEGDKAGLAQLALLEKGLLKGASAVGVFWGAFTAREPQVNADNFTQLFDWVQQGLLKPHISKRYPLAEASQALRDMMDRKVTGKIVLTP